MEGPNRGQCLKKCENTLYFLDFDFLRYVSIAEWSLFTLSLWQMWPAEQLAGGSSGVRQLQVP